MATVILRPIADNEFKHSCSSGSVGYALINEEIADSDASYIYKTVTSTTNTGTTSWFRLSSPEVGKIKINSYIVKVTARYTGKTNDQGSMGIYVIKDGATDKVGDTIVTATTYREVSRSYDGFTGMVIDDFENSEISLVGVNTSGYKDASKNDDYQVRVTQLYIELSYEEVSEPRSGVYLKQNGAYAQANAVWQKVNGIWVASDKGIFDVSKRYKLTQ